MEGGGRDLYVWSEPAPSPPPPLHGKTGEHGAGSVGGGSNGAD